MGLGVLEGDTRTHIHTHTHTLVQRSVLTLARSNTEGLWIKIRCLEKLGWERWQTEGNDSELRKL